MKRIIRKISAVFMICVITVSAAGCGSKDKSAKNLNVKEPEVLTVWYDDERYGDYLEYVAQQFHNANELITINPVFVNQDSYLEYIYNESIKNDNAPDLYLMNSENLEKACMIGIALENGEDSSFYNEKNYASAAIKASLYNGKSYGYPVTFNTPFLVYNKKIGQPVDNLKQIVDFCNGYTVNDDNQDVKQIVLWNLNDEMLNYGFSGGNIDIDGSDSNSASGVRVNKNGIENCMKSVSELKDQLAIDYAKESTEICAQNFAAGYYVYTITNCKNLKILDDSGISYGVCKTPSVDSDTPNTSYSEHDLVVVNPYSSDIDAAKAVAASISYDYSDMIYDKTGYLSAHIIKSKGKSDLEKNHDEIYDVYSNTQPKASYVGQSYFYSKYEIMFSKVCNGTDPVSAVNEFISETKAIEKNN